MRADKNENAVALIDFIDSMNDNDLHLQSFYAATIFKVQSTLYIHVYIIRSCRFVIQFTSQRVAGQQIFYQSCELGISIGVYLWRRTNVHVNAFI